MAERGGTALPLLVAFAGCFLAPLGGRFALAGAVLIIGGLVRFWWLLDRADRGR